MSWLFSALYRHSPPIELEKNESDILLIFQAPGIEEWKVGKAIQPTKKPGGTAGRRIELSWKRKGKVRADFDIINTVQCFPGNNGGRDLSPNILSICSCQNRLREVIKNNKYDKIITFGKIAKNIIENLNTPSTIINSKHPTGGLKNSDLDKLW